jgi:predicted GNAT family N-acyltransferase
MDENASKNLAERLHWKSPPLADHVHGKVLPAAVFSAENISVSLRRKTPVGEAIIGQLWHISPFGIELLQKDAATLSVGETVDILLNLNNQKLNYTAQVTGVDTLLNQGNLIGLRFIKEPRVYTVDSRKIMRWECDPIYQPTGSARNALRFNDTVYFHVRNISSSGLLMYTSLRNKYLLPGSMLKSEITFPCIGSAVFDLTVNHVRETTDESKPFLAVGVTFSATSKSALALCGQYLLQFGSAAGEAPSIAELRQQGFIHKSSAAAIDLSYVRTKEEYDDVLALRLKSFQGTLVLENMKEPSSWADIFDSRARILIGRHRGKAVVTSRIVFPEKDDELENERFVKLPDSLPSREQIVEVGRLCVDPSYRGNDLLISVLRYTLTTVLQGGRNYILINCTDELKPLYGALGYMPTGATFKHANDGQRHHVYILNARRTICGLDISPKYWMWAFVPIWAQLEEYADAPSLPLLDRLRLRTYLLIAAAYGLQQRWFRGALPRKRKSSK